MANVAVHRGDKPDAFITFDVVNASLESVNVSFGFVILGLGNSGPLGSPVDLAPGAVRAFTIPTERLRDGKNDVVVRMYLDGRTGDSDSFEQWYRKVPTGGLPDLKFEHVRRVSAGAGVYSFTVHNVGHAASPPYRVQGALNPGPPACVYPSPDTSPGLAPGQSLDFVLKDVPEHYVGRFELHLWVDPEDKIPEENEENNFATTGVGDKGPWAERHP
jgi:hypothetical protein